MIKPEFNKKTQKIASAIYLVTGFFDEKEPLKWKLRALASSIVSSAIYIKDSSYSMADKSVVDLRQNLVEIEGLFTVAKHAGMVSDLNYDILVNELNKCISTLSPVNEYLADSNNLLLSRDYFDASAKALPEIKSNFVKDKSISTTFYASSPEKEKSRELLPSIHSLQSNKGHFSNIEHKQLKEFGAVAVKKNSRQSIIVNLLKRKKEIMIKDITPLIDGCSEKTIQRELMAMVHSGILNKVGEKRWSRYSLAKPQD